MTIGIRSLRADRVALYGIEGEPDEGAELDVALDAALSFAESMGFLFDEDELGEGGAQAKTRCLGLWRDLLGDDAGAPSPARRAGRRSPRASCSSRSWPRRRPRSRARPGERRRRRRRSPRSATSCRTATRTSNADAEPGSDEARTSSAPSSGRLRRRGAWPQAAQAARRGGAKRPGERCAHEVPRPPARADRRERPRAPKGAAPRRAGARPGGRGGAAEGGERRRSAACVSCAACATACASATRSCACSARSDPNLEGPFAMATITRIARVLPRPRARAPCSRRALGCATTNPATQADERPQGARALRAGDEPPARGPHRRRDRRAAGGRGHRARRTPGSSSLSPRPIA